MQPTRQIWDISAPLNTATVAYPGDTPYQQQWTARIGPQCPVNVSAMTLSPHIGTHADAPLHYDPQGLSIGDVDLTPFLGTCRVIHAIGCGPRVGWVDISHALSAPLPARILVRTYQRVPEHWDACFSGLAPAALDKLADLGVQLIGIDTPSIDPASSKGLDSHMVVRQRQMRVLESLRLDDVQEGDYELIALPLKLTQADASPVRAILRAL